MLRKSCWRTNRSLFVAVSLLSPHDQILSTGCVLLRCLPVPPVLDAQSLRSQMLIVTPNAHVHKGGNSATFCLKDEMCLWTQHTLLHLVTSLVTCISGRCAVRWLQGDVDSETFALGSSPACVEKVSVLVFCTPLNIVTVFFVATATGSSPFRGLGACVEQNCALGSRAICCGGVWSLEPRRASNILIVCILCHKFLVSLLILNIEIGCHYSSL